eukprot:4364707-Amphidinium_carterae.4
MSGWAEEDLHDKTNHVLGTISFILSNITVSNAEAYLWFVFDWGWVQNYEATCLQPLDISGTLQTPRQGTLQETLYQDAKEIGVQSAINL